MLGRALAPPPGGSTRQAPESRKSRKQTMQLHISGSARQTGRSVDLMPAISGPFKFCPSGWQEEGVKHRDTSVLNLAICVCKMCSIVQALRASRVRSAAPFGLRSGSADLVRRAGSMPQRRPRASNPPMNQPAASTFGVGGVAAPALCLWVCGIFGQVPGKHSLLFFADLW